MLKETSKKSSNTKKKLTAVRDWMEDGLRSLLGQITPDGRIMYDTSKSGYGFCSPVAHRFSH
ncbi:hypothetical protein D0T87_24400 [Bacteroides sp. 51]|nr:hypothetical protein [Bacteroides sp. 51]